MQSVVVCKQDCFFDRLLNSNFTDDKANFSKEIMASMNSKTILQCQSTLVKLLPPRNSTNASTPLSLSDVLSATGNGAIPLAAIFSQTEIANIPAKDALKVLNTFIDNIDDASKSKLVKKLGQDTNASDLDPRLLSSVRPEIIANAPVADLLANIKQFADNCDTSQALVITRKITITADANTILQFLNNTGSNFAEMIPLDVILSKNINLKDIPEKSMSGSMVNI